MTAPILAGRRALTRDDYERVLRDAQAEFLRAEAAYNAACNARGQAAHLAALKTDITWREIGEILGGIKGTTAQMLRDRYLAAIAEGRTMGLANPKKRKAP